MKGSSRNSKPQPAIDHKKSWPALRVLWRSDSLAAAAKGFDRCLGMILVIAAGLLVAGWLLPVMSLRTLYIFYDEISILTGTFRLYGDGEYLLFFLLLVFTIIFPAAKLALTYHLWNRLTAQDPRLLPALGRIETLGKWSMLDVFVVAILVVVIKLSLVTTVDVHAGLYVFSAAVLISMLAVKRIVALAHRATAKEPYS